MPELDVSIIIVSYNVKHFLDQCVESVLRARGILSVEVIIADNASIDGSASLIQEKYPEVEWIQMKENVGFAVANNEAIRRARGKYILLLNPDTLVQEDTLVRCFDYLNESSNCGALGVKMIDGSGDFLPESKRGYPTLWASFCKFSGLGKLFPNSSLFNQYYLGHLDKEKQHSVDVLSGAFMFIPKTVLDKVGLFDEDFFMYGEDIDLSYRIKNAGLDIDYLPSTRIVHYKGESTKRGSYQYIRSFYKAMIIFAEKHQKGPVSGLSLLFIKMAVYLSASINLLKQAIRKLIHPILDLILITTVLFELKNFWAHWYHENPAYYEQAQLLIPILFFGFTWISSLYVFGNYDSKSSGVDLIRGIGMASIILLLIYAVLPEAYRPSRAILILGSCCSFMLLLLSKLIVNRLQIGAWSLSKPIQKNSVIVALQEDAEVIKDLLQNNRIDTNVFGVVCPNENEKDSYYLNHLDHLQEIVDKFRINEIIFSAQALEFGMILQKMTELGNKAQFKIASKGNKTVLGSPSKNERGELYTYDFAYNILLPTNQRIRKIFNYALSTLLLVLLPISFVLSGLRVSFIRALWLNLIGKRTWVGYDQRDEHIHRLPKILSGVIPVSVQLDKKQLNLSEVHNINSYYASNYGMFQDSKVILQYLLRFYLR